MDAMPGDAASDGVIVDAPVDSASDPDAGVDSSVDLGTDAEIVDLGMDVPVLPTCSSGVYNATTGKCYATIDVGVGGTQCADIGMEEAWWMSTSDQAAIQATTLADLGVTSGASTALYYSPTYSAFVWWTHETVPPAVTWATVPRGTDRFAYLTSDGMHSSSVNPRTPVLCQRDPP